MNGKIRFKNLKEMDKYLESEIMAECDGCCGEFDCKNKTKEKRKCEGCNEYGVCTCNLKKKCKFLKLKDVLIGDDLKAKQLICEKKRIGIFVSDKVYEVITNTQLCRDCEEYEVD